MWDRRNNPHLRYCFCSLGVVSSVPHLPENYGGPIVTAGGLLFIAATDFDKEFRAFDKTTGALLWKAILPYPGNATPITYEVKGRQYVVIASGGSYLNQSGALGGVYVAYALP